MRLIVTGSSFIKTIATFVRLAGHWWHVEVGKGSATAAANSFQARKGATGVIGHNLVDSLIYKQSLMKFLVFINNALQPRALVCRHRYPGIPRCLSLSPFPSHSLPPPFIPFHFPAHTASVPRVPSSDTLYRPGFQPTLALSATKISRMNQRANMLHIVTVALDFFIDHRSTNRVLIFRVLIFLKTYWIYIILIHIFSI